MSGSGSLKRLAQVPLFSAVPPSALAELAARLGNRTFDRGAVLFRRGDAGDAVYVIESGAVKISRLSPDGREIVMALLGPGEVLGELALLDSGVRTADATAIEDTSTLVIDNEALRRFLEDHPAVAIHLLEVLAVRLRETNEALQDAIFSDVPGRLAKRLVDLSERYGAEIEDGTMIDMALTQEQLAQMVGAARESVNKAVASFLSRGWLSMKGRRYVVTDADALRRRAT